MRNVKRSRGGSSVPNNVVPKVQWPRQVQLDSCNVPLLLTIRIVTGTSPTRDSGLLPRFPSRLSLITGLRGKHLSWASRLLVAEPNRFATSCRYYMLAKQHLFFISSTVKPTGVQEHLTHHLLVKQGLNTLALALGLGL